MKVLVLYRPNSDHGRLVDEFINNLKASGLTDELEVLVVDSQEGNFKATIYDITRYPAVLVVRDDGTMQHLWQGLDLPLVNEVQGYLRA